MTTAPTASFTGYVSITNPDDPHGMPSFEGDITRAGHILIPGTYPATGETETGDGDTTDVPGTVTITGTDATFTPHEDAFVTSTPAHG